MPGTDVADFTDDLKSFMIGVAGRDQAYASVIAGALLPDMLLVYPKRNGTPVFLLSWVVGGVGGRSLPHARGDIGVGAVFRGLLRDNNQVTPGLPTRHRGA